MEECLLVVSGNSLVTAAEAHESVVFDNGVFSRRRLEKQVDDVKRSKSGFTKIVQGSAETGANSRLEE